MSQKMFIKDMKVKDDVDTHFLVKYMSLNEAKDGKKYLNIILTDNSGDLASRVWNNAEEIYESIEKGKFVRAVGKVNFFQNKKQFVINEINPIDESEIQKEDFILKAPLEAESMFKDLLKIVNELDDVYIEDLLNFILADEEIYRRFRTWQAGKTIHHAYQSGLLEHVLSCAQLAIYLSAHYKVNKNYVVAGAVLHDLCKIYELSDGYNVEYTEEGKLVGHLVKAVELVDRFCYKIKDFPYDLKLHLKHILLSHHGEYEYGSPKVPQTSEAFLVHLIDLMDSKMHTVEAVKKTDTNSVNWFGFVIHLYRIIFKDSLPFYSEFINNHDSKPKQNKIAKPRELKQNLGKLLSDFKIK